MNPKNDNNFNYFIHEISAKMAFQEKLNKPVSSLLCNFYFNN